MPLPTKTINPAKSPTPFQIGNLLAFELGRGATTGTVVAVTGENVLIRHDDGLDIFTLKDLAKRKAVIIPQRPSFWQRTHQRWHRRPSGCHPRKTFPAVDHPRLVRLARITPKRR